MAKLRHLAIACKDPDAMAESYIKAFDFTVARRGDGPFAPTWRPPDRRHDRPGAPALQVGPDRQGHGLTGLHHFGILVEDVDAAAKQAQSAGGKHYMDQSDEARIGGFEVKMYGPEGVLFDIAEHPWTGTEPLAVPERRPSRRRNKSSTR